MLGERFEIAFADDESEQRLPLVQAWSVPFEACRPVRQFPSYKGQRHYSGRWWTATTSTLVEYGPTFRMIFRSPDLPFGCVVGAVRGGIDKRGTWGEPSR